MNKHTQGSPQPTQGNPEFQEIVGPVGPPGPRGAQGPAGPASSPGENVSNPPQWTPELKMQAGKEVVTALLGIVIVVYTLLAVYRTMDYVGDPNRMGQAKDMVMLLVGLTGSVFGYYFGRIPADARAAQSQQQASEAIAETRTMKIESRVMADELDTMMTAMNAMKTNSQSRTVDEELARMGDQIRAMRNKLQAMAS